MQEFNQVKKENNLLIDKETGDTLDFGEPVISGGATMVDLTKVMFDKLYRQSILVSLSNRQLDAEEKNL